MRRNVEAARGDLGAVAATLRDAQVSIIAEVARDYLILRGLQDQLALTERNADNQMSSLKLRRNTRPRWHPFPVCRHRLRPPCTA